MVVNYAEPGAEAVAEAARSVEQAVRSAARGLVERQVLVELIVLAAVAGEHLLVVGEPGTAKSEAVRRVARAFGGRYFEYLLGRFTEPSELFGPINLLKLQEGKLETETAGMLPEAEIAFLDEVFLGSTAILNTLLGILNERRFRRGHSEIQVPLRLCVAASNALPEDAALAAFADRFLVRTFVAAVPDAELETLLAAGAENGATQELLEKQGPLGLGELDLLAAARQRVDLTELRPLLADAVRRLRRAGIALTDRRIVRAQSLVAAATVLRGLSTADARDLWPIVYVVPTALEQSTARDVLRELLQASESALSAAALDASWGPRARATRIVAAAEQILATEPAEPDRSSWKLRLEGIAREIDASFSREQLPEPLPALRARIELLVADT